MGSTAFAGSVDTILVMKRSERMRTLSCIQRYGGDLEEVVLAMDEVGGLMLLAPSASMMRLRPEKLLRRF
jgi:hypothetical protein